MAVWRRFMAGALALCLALAGLAGIHPALHRLMEHAGQGPMHVHRGEQARAHSHPHRHPHRHSHELPAASAAAKLGVRGAFVSNHPSFSLPWQRVWQAVSGLLERSYSNAEQDERDNQESAPSPDESQHEHHSLVQLLASGLVELVTQGALLSFEFSASSSLATPPQDRLSYALFEPQTAGRAPPLLWS